MEEFPRTDGPELWPADRARPYSNHLEIAFNVSEVELCFAQAFDGAGQLAPHSWVQTTPVHLVSFGEAIRRTIDSYEGRYGPLPQHRGTS